MEEEKLTVLERDYYQMQKELIGVHHVLTSQGNILQEMKETLAKQNETLNLVAKVQMEAAANYKETEELKKIFESRKKETDQKHLEFNDFVSRVKGGLRVGVFCLSILQAAFGYIVVRSTDEISKTQDKVLIIERELTVLKTIIKKEH